MDTSNPVQLLKEKLVQSLEVVFVFWKSVSKHKMFDGQRFAK